MGLFGPGASSQQTGYELIMSEPSENLKEEAFEEIHIVQPAPKKRRWVNYVWDSLDKSPEERRFLFKLDTVVLTMAFLGHFVKKLDQTNVNSAFVSGMKEDLNLYGNQLNYMQTAWTVGYVIGELPSTVLLTRVRPSVWLPLMELTWTILTFATAKCNHAYQLYVIRFFVGLAESAFYPGTQYVIGSWYKEDELAKRSCIFASAAAVAGMCSGYLMAGAYNLNNVLGLKGWQWLFILDGCISLPIAVAGFFILPDVPEITRAFYLSKEERQLATKRMDDAGRKPRAPYTKAKIKRILKSWHLYLLSLLYVCFNNSAAIATEPIFSQYLKSHKHPKYTVAQINAYPTATNAVVVVAMLVYGWTSDGPLQGRRWPWMIFAGGVNIMCYGSLAIWDIPTGWRWFCYIFVGAGVGISGLIMAWTHEICSDDNEERAIVIGTANQMAFVMQAWIPLLVWQQVEAPRYHKGFVTVSCLSGVMIVLVLVTRKLHARQMDMRARVSGAAEE